MSRRDPWLPSVDAARHDARFRALVAVTGQFVWCGDHEGRSAAAAAWLAKFTGLAPSDAPDFWLAAVHPADRAIVDYELGNALTAGRELRVCFRLRSAAGHYRNVEIRAAPVKDERHVIHEWVGTLADVSERSEAALQEANARLLEADQRKNEFLAVLSHELRNPLAPIKNSIYILERALPDGEQARRAKSVIHRQVNHLSRLVDDLLDITRVSRNKITLKREDLDLNELVRRVAEDQRSVFEQNELELSVETASMPVVVHGDSARMAQVLSNLLQNAVKFTVRGGTTTVRVERSGDGWAILRVRDSGIGMPPDTLARIFEPFVQSERTLNRSDGGLGLGLALVRGLVELHGGDVTAESEGFGSGSEFIVRLPLVVRRSEISPSPPAPEPSEVSHSRPYF